MISVAHISAPRRALDYYSTSARVERPAEESLLPSDKVSLSPEARGALERVGGTTRSGLTGQETHSGAGEEAQPGAPGQEQASGRGGQLTPEQRREVQELQQRDTHVRAHEAAHQAAGGDLTGPASFSYQLGPDGRSYAVGGEVPIQSRSGRTPDETIAIARRVRAAALAPSDPSAADLAAASAASQVELKAVQQKRQATPPGQAGAAARPAAAGAAAPISTPQANLERLIVRAPEAEPFM